MAAWEGKKYKLVKSENFDEYMKAIGVSNVMRKMGNTLCSIVFLAFDGASYIFVSETSFKSTKMAFKLGQEFIEETVDGRKVPSVITMEGNTMIQYQKGDHPTKIIREFTEEDCVMTITYGDLISKRWYRIVENCYPHEHEED